MIMTIHTPLWIIGVTVAFALWLVLVGALGP